MYDDIRDVHIIVRLEGGLVVYLVGFEGQALSNEVNGVLVG
jgi:hypothetical protein